MKVVLLFCAPMPITFGVKLHTNYIKENKFEIEYWNMSNIFFSKEELTNYYIGNSKYRYEYKDEKIFFNKKQFYKELNILKKSQNKYIFWCYDFNNYNDFWIRRIFKIYNILYFIGPKRTQFKNYLIKTKKFKRYTLERVISALKRRFDIKYIYKNLNFLIFKKTNYYQHPLFVMGSGKLGFEINKYFFPKSKFLDVPSFDVDWTNINENNEEICVYVDDAIDFGISKKVNQRENAYLSCIDVDKFYFNLRNFFDKIEKIFKKKIIIAAAGKYYHKDTQKFGDREVVYNQTNNLIKKSKIVIGHESSGLWQSVISRKKMILLEDPTFTIEKKNAIMHMSIFLDLPVLDLSKITEKNINEYFNSYNRDYKDLIYQYFSTNLDSKEYKYILIDEFNKIRENNYTKN